MEYNFVVCGEPIAKGRPKFSVVNGIIQTHTPKKTTDYEMSVYNSFISYYPDKNINYENGVEIEIVAYFQIPQSFSKKKKLEMEGKNMLNRPDIDNVCKSILDGLNKIFDDKYIFSVKAIKKWSINPRCEIKIKEC